VDLSSHREQSRWLPRIPLVRQAHDVLAGTVIHEHIRRSRTRRHRSHRRRRRRLVTARRRRGASSGRRDAHISHHPHRGILVRTRRRGANEGRTSTRCRREATSSIPTQQSITDRWNHTTPIPSSRGNRSCRRSHHHITPRRRRDGSPRHRHDSCYLFSRRKC
jgi:hypothetical protein